MGQLNTIKRLYIKYLDEEISEPEQKMLYDFFETATEEEISSIVGEFLQTSQAPDDLSHLSTHMANLFAQIKQRTIEENSKTILRTRQFLMKYLLPAAAMLLLAMGVYLSSLYWKTPVDSTTHLSANDIAPGKMGATLTLANGQKIRLSAATNGEIAVQAGLRVTKTADGQLVYETIENSAAKAELNTLATGKGETYAVVLPDKSKVWLNAESKITYPLVLNQHGVRRVRISGEGYFEISKDKAHPFIVESAGQEIKVLGTHFNVDSYEGETHTKTTLLEGSVAVSSTSKTESRKILKPNQEAQLTANGISVRDVDPEYAVAWKNGIFIFDSENLESIMNKLSRWYNVNVIYDDPELKSRTFLGTVSKYDNLSKVLKVLQRTNVAEFSIEGNTVRIKTKKAE